MKDLSRHRRETEVKLCLRRTPVVALLGPRQCGKSTLARAIARSAARATFFDLEDPRDLAKLDDPMLLLGESLAGRIEYLEMDGFALDEAGAQRFDPLWLRGGFPRSLLSRTEAQSVAWRRGFVKSFVERDLPQLGSSVSASIISRFWSMLAHYHGQIWNASEFARAFGVSEASVRRYADLLTETFVVRRLNPWAENLGKRQVKSPKLYVSDSGLLHSLLGIHDRAELERHPKVGASWEGFGITQIIERLGVSRDECYFWATQAGAELDLLVVRGDRRLGFEFKRTTAPAVTKSMQIAKADLRLTSLDVVHAGDHTFPLRDGIRALALKRVLTDLNSLR
jgi:predicted AAA+ superfamily ATPase